MSQQPMSHARGGGLATAVAVLALSMALMGCAGTGGSPANAVPRAAERLPSIVVLYADDLGYGDLGAYGGTAIPTRNVDRMSATGLRLTDAHATAATCTPSRYSLLTGEYGFRAKAEILPGDAPALIRPEKLTLPDVLKSRGYATAVVGKWHLGLGDGTVDWNGEVRPGPREIGFDYSFLLPSTADRVPSVYLENQRVVGLDPADPLSVSYTDRVGDRPVGHDSQDRLRYRADPQHSGSVINGVSRIGYMKGGKAAEWRDEDFAEVLTGRALRFIRSNRDRPFFLFFPFHDPHVPRMPAKRFQGATKLGPRGDAIVQMDWMVGEVLAELERLGIADQTLVILSSDNGPVLNDGYEDGAAELNGAHRPAGPYRGGKYSAFEAGARVPTIVHWPGRVAAGVSGALVSQVDLFASLSALAGAELPDGVAIDSRNQLGAWLGRDARGRDHLFKEAVVGYTVRESQLKYIAPVRNAAQAAFVAGKGIESGASPRPQLYDLSADAGETRDLAADRPEDVTRLQGLLQQILRQTSAERRDGVAAR